MHSMGRARRSVIDAGRRIASSQRISLWLRLQRQLAALARRLAPIRRSRSLRWLSYVRVVHRSYTVRIDAVAQRRMSRNSRADRTSGCGAIFERQDLARNELANADPPPRRRGAARSQPQDAFARLSAMRPPRYPSILYDTSWNHRLEELAGPRCMAASPVHIVLFRLLVGGP